MTRKSDIDVTFDQHGRPIVCATVGESTSPPSIVFASVEMPRDPRFLQPELGHPYKKGTTNA